MPIYETANWYADGERFQLPEDFYSSKFLIDKTIEFIDANRRDSQPFFAYVPFQAVHIPVQAPQEYIDKYIGIYDEGWHKLRESRHDRAVSMGVLPDTVAMQTMATTDDWQALNAERKRSEAKRMVVYAAMIEAMDHNIGRLISYLKDSGLYESTIFVFTSDNGAEGSGSSDPTAFAASRISKSLGYNTDYETLGLKSSYSTISPSFTSAAVSPLAFYKFYVGEGGLRVPLIISGQPLGKTPRQTAAFAWATDIAATILSYAGVDQPGPRYAGRPVLPITGRDLKPVVSGKADRVYGPEDAVGYELTGHSVLFQGEYKLLRNQPPLGDGQWYLYDIAQDPGEVTDLKALMPQRLQRMLSAYETFERDNKVQPMAPGYSQPGQLAKNFIRNQSRSAVIVGLLTLLVLLPFLVAIRMRRQHKR